jgi:hypothetical protein
MLRLALVGAVVVAMGIFAGSASGASVIATGGGTPGTERNFVQVGHNPLFNRGMNAAPAVYKNFIYIGNRTDGSTFCEDGVTTGCARQHPGVLIVDAAQPSNPQVVGEIGPPHAAQIGVTTRELRVWPREKLLIVMTFRCSNAIHACPPGTDETFPFELKFFDLTDPRAPRFLTSYVPTSRAGEALKPHEMHLWIDPKDRDRALLYLSLTRREREVSVPNIIVADISDVADGGPVRHIAEANFNGAYEASVNADNLYLHSMGVSANGRRTHFAQIAGTYLNVDSSDIAENRPNPALRLRTDPLDRPYWTNPNAHSAFEVPGRKRYVLTTDEIYGEFTDPTHGCPWGWMRMLNVRDPGQPRIISSYRLAEDTSAFCATARGQDDQRVSFSAHNPTLLRKLALLTWHSGGLQAIDIGDPSNPEQAGWFTPTPLPDVAVEDPALGDQGRNNSIMWSFPIIRKGLIYVVDVRNGLYVLRYTGPRAKAVRKVGFLEGNSNRGSALRISRVKVGPVG